MREKWILLGASPADEEGIFPRELLQLVERPTLHAGGRGFESAILHI